MSELTDGGSTASHGPWRWLIDLRDHLLPDVEVLDVEGRPVLPPVRGDVADRLRRLIAPPQLPLVAAFLRAATPGDPMMFIHADGLRIGVVGLIDSTGVRYTLIVAERADAGRDATRRIELSRMASWLARALVSASTNPVRDWHEISVLHQVLQKAVASGSLDAVLGTYVEALAIWADTDSRAYLGDRSGRFALAVSLAGAHASDAPRVLREEAVVSFAGLHRLSVDEARRLGFSTERDTLVSSIHIADHAPWVIAYSGHVSALDEDRLALFEDMLRPALLATAEVEASRLTWVMMQHLVDGPLPPSDAAALALADLERAGLCTAMWVVRRDDGAIVLQGGLPLPDFANAGGWPGFSVQHYPLEVPFPYQASLTLWRPPNRPFTQRENRLGSIGASVLGRWVTNALRRDLLTAGEHTASGVERRTTRASSNVSLLVILPEPTDTAANVRDTWVRHIQRELRTDDIVGAVATGDLGVLLRATSRDQAQAVATRLTQLFAELAPLALLDGARISIASGSGGTPTAVAT